ncbi:MAG: helix-turn-helix domain-containing protein [Pseudonocardiales bacterium]|nr:helix-turn-helix domain-containing protein [Pseudonocardiales bacterium]
MVPSPRTVDDDLLARVTALRADGLTPKEIARSLSLRPSIVTPLIRQIARRAAAGEPEVIGCWVSPGWRRNLHIHGHHDWLDVPATDDGAEGLAGVVVARHERPYPVSAAGYLVDTYCLGVKNALGPRSMSDSDLPTFLRRFFAAFGGDAVPLEASLELTRHLVWGAVQHARRLGFGPHPDLAPVSGHLGTWDETSAITFGHDGVPYYVRAAGQRPRGHPYPHPHRRRRQLPLPHRGRLSPSHQCGFSSNVPIGLLSAVA